MAAFYKIYGQTVPTLQTGDALEKVIINEVQEVDAVRICQEKQSISLGTSMGQTQKWADFHLVMNGQTWKASRAIICPQSRVFMKFCNEPKNRDKPLVIMDIHGMADNMKPILTCVMYFLYRADYVYNKKSPTNDLIKNVAIHDAARFFQIDALHMLATQRIETFLKSTPSALHYPDLQIFNDMPTSKRPNASPLWPELRVRVANMYAAEDEWQGRRTAYRNDVVSVASQRRIFEEENAKLIQRSGEEPQNADNIDPALLTDSSYPELVPDTQIDVYEASHQSSPTDGCPLAI